MNRKEDTVLCYYAHNSVWTCELGYGADTMFHRTYFCYFNQIKSNQIYFAINLVHNITMSLHCIWLDRQAITSRFNDRLSKALRIFWTDFRNFSPHDRYLIVDCRSDPVFPMA